MNPSRHLRIASAAILGLAATASAGVFDGLVGLVRETIDIGKGYRPAPPAALRGDASAKTLGGEARGQLQQFAIRSSAALQRRISLLKAGARRTGDEALIGQVDAIQQDAIRADRARRNWITETVSGKGMVDSALVPETLGKWSTEFQALEARLQSVGSLVAKAQREATPPEVAAASTGTDTKLTTATAREQIRSRVMGRVDELSGRLRKMRRRAGRDPNLRRQIRRPTDLVNRTRRQAKDFVQTTLSGTAPTVSADVVSDRIRDWEKDLRISEVQVDRVGQIVAMAAPPAPQKAPEVPVEPEPTEEADTEEPFEPLTPETADDALASLTNRVVGFESRVQTGGGSLGLDATEDKLRAMQAQIARARKSLFNQPGGDE